ncbi:calcium-binding protein [Paremcibacter congregatus]|uniref:calcium-binding protein n=1 Tax=Paremcibacter congregatus TaxID=2043170 RepID=UPI0030ECF2DB
MGAISYHWYRDGNDTGEVGDSYFLEQADVGSTITVQARYIDGQSNNESVTSSATIAIANVNDTPSGGVFLSGAAIEGQTLMVSNNIADIDGLGAISYHWYRDGNDTGEVGETYLLAQADVGSILTVQARYTDGQGTDESVTSVATSEILPINVSAVTDEVSNVTFAPLDLSYDLPGNNLTIISINGYARNPGDIFALGAGRGKVIFNADQTLTYSPNDSMWNESGDIFEYVVSDEFGNTYAGAINIVIESNPEIIRGGTGDDIIDGDSNDNIIYGDSGDDILKGGLGKDYLSGGMGNNIFYLLESENGQEDIFRGGSDHGHNKLIIEGNIGQIFDLDISTIDAGGIDEFHLGEGAQTFAINQEDINKQGGFYSTSNTYVVLISGDASDSVINTGPEWSHDFRLFDMYEGELYFRFGSPSGRVYIDEDIEMVGFPEFVPNYIETGTNQYTSLNTDIGYSFFYDNNSIENITYTGNDNYDNIRTGSGDDYIDLGGNKNTAASGAGNDTIYGGQYTDVIYGEAGADIIYGNYGSDKLYGGQGNDEIHGGGTSDYIYGGDGNDIIYGDSHVDYLYGDEGNDILNGGSSYDFLFGGAGDDILNGDIGDDYFYGDIGADTIDGGSGFHDKMIYILSTSGVSVNLVSNINTGGDADGDTLINVEDIEGSNFNDVIIGDSNNNKLNGKGGVDILSGGDGDDILFAFEVDGSHEDHFDGGAGFDILELVGKSMTTYPLSPNHTIYEVNLANLDVINIEQINLSVTVDDFSEHLTLTLDDVLNVTDEDNILYIDGSGDTVTSVGQGWIRGEDVYVDYYTTFHTYTSGGATLYVEEDIIQDIS